MDSKKYNKLDPSIHKLSSQLSLNEDARKIANEQLSQVLQIYLLPAMKEVDDDFQNLFQRVHYSGSYYENLRICKANEFDLNLELRSQSKSRQFLQVCSNEDYPGFVQIQHLSSDINRKWVNENGYVLQHKVLYWLQGVVDKALVRKGNVPGLKIWRKMSGPAVTLYVQYSAGELFTVDVVPVFMFGSKQWPKPPVRQPVIADNSYAEEWCVVPKPNDFVDRCGNRRTFWRISFYQQEKKILNNKNHLKNALKLMKLLRDEEVWQCLSSYYLKTLYLWAVTENDFNYWNNGIGVVFMNMLRKLKDYLKDRKSIPFFWDQRYNLLSPVNPDEIVNIGFRLERIIKDIDRNIDDNPRYIETLFSRRNRYSSTENPDTEGSEAGTLAMAPQQESSFGWADLAVAVGALTLGGVLLYKSINNNNRDQ